MTTRVVNRRKASFDVYIGRPSEFGNPYTLAEHSREEAIQLFGAYAEDRIRRDPEWAAKVKALKGKTLGCWCSPKKCHGDVLAEIAERD